MSAFALTARSCLCAKMGLSANMQYPLRGSPERLVTGTVEGPRSVVAPPSRGVFLVRRSRRGRPARRMVLLDRVLRWSKILNPAKP
jgi:hypothetical protein